MKEITASLQKAMKLCKCVLTVFQLYLLYLIKDFFQMISQPGALEPPQSDRAESAMDI